MLEFLSPDSIAVTIRMLRETFSGSFLLVEGDVDARFFKRFVDNLACHVHVCFCRASVIRVVSLLDEGGFIGHLGIIDKDFADIFGEHLDGDNLIYTDENDIELTIFQSDVFERVLHEYCNEGRVAALEAAQAQPIREILLQNGSKLGAIRYLSRARAWHLVFSEMTLRYTPDRSISIDVDRQIEHLRGRSHGTSMPILEQVRAAVDEVYNTHQGRLLTCGPDICEILSKAIHDVCGRAHVALSRGGIALGEVFRAAFSRENFAATQLCAQIREWESMRPGFRILPVAA
jgi:hypothetical protein